LAKKLTWWKTKGENAKRRKKKRNNSSCGGKLSKPRKSHADAAGKGITTKKNFFQEADGSLLPKKGNGTQRSEPLEESLTHSTRFAKKTTIATGKKGQVDEPVPRGWKELGTFRRKEKGPDGAKGVQAPEGAAEF